MVAMSVFLAVIPLILSLEGTRALLLRLKLGHILPKASRWASIGWIWVMGPSTLIILIFGVLTTGSSGNMRTTHGVSIAEKETLITCWVLEANVLSVTDPRTYHCHHHIRSYGLPSFQQDLHLDQSPLPRYPSLSSACAVQTLRPTDDQHIL